MALKTTGGGGTSDYLAWKRSKEADANRSFVRGETLLANEFQTHFKRDILRLKRFMLGNANSWDKGNIANWTQEYRETVQQALDASLEG